MSLGFPDSEVQGLTRDGVSSPPLILNTHPNITYPPFTIIYLYWREGLKLGAGGGGGFMSRCPGGAAVAGPSTGSGEQKLAQGLVLNLGHRRSERLTESFHRTSGRLQRVIRIL